MASDRPDSERTRTIAHLFSEAGGGGPVVASEPRLTRLTPPQPCRGLVALHGRQTDSMPKREAETGRVGCGICLRPVREPHPRPSEQGVCRRTRTSSTSWRAIFGWDSRVEAVPDEFLTHRQIARCMGWVLVRVQKADTESLSDEVL